MNKVALNLAIIGLLAFGAVTADAAAVAKAVSKAAARRIVSGTVAKQLPKQKLGYIHTFKKPTTLVRATNRPATERVRGIGIRNGHVFTRYPKPGRTGGAEHIQKELAIHHKVKAMQQLKVPAGTKYHVRPIKGGEKNMDEVIIHGRLPGSTVVQDRRLAHVKRETMSR
jgi:hypothetical protein